MKKLLLFDLEETLIDDWSTMNIFDSMSFPILNQWIQKEKIGSQVGLLSWAVWDEKDLNSFNKFLRDFIEDEFRIRFNDKHILLRDFVIGKFREWFRMPFLDSNDFMSFFKKEHVMFELWKNHFNDFDEIVFLDDTVGDITMECDGRILRLVDAKKLTKKEPIGSFFVLSVSHNSLN